jgi:hypothetical protein
MGNESLAGLSFNSQNGELHEGRKISIVMG